VTLRLGVLEGDGIGPEIVPAALAAADAALRRANTAVEWVPLPVGLRAIAAHGAALPPSTVAALETLDGWVMGPHDNVSYPPAHRATLNPSGALRKHFDLYANIRPARTFRNVPATVRSADLVIVRENTEGFYADRNTFAGTGEFMPTADVAITLGVFTRPRIERIAHEAFRLARRRRHHVTIVHKANVLAATAFFRDICREVARGYADVALDDVHVDAMASSLVRRPAGFDVIVTENMFGDILSDLAGELTGSLGLAASLNASDRTAMAQAAHGSAPDIAGRGIAVRSEALRDAVVEVPGEGFIETESEVLLAWTRLIPESDDRIEVVDPMGDEEPAEAVNVPDWLLTAVAAAPEEDSVEAANPAGDGT